MMELRIDKVPAHNYHVSLTAGKFFTSDLKFIADHDYDAKNTQKYLIPQEELRLRTCFIPLKDILPSINIMNPFYTWNIFT